MATTTTQLALRKPVGSDQVNVTTDIADNVQKIDDAFDPAAGHTHAGTTGKGPNIVTAGIADLAVTGAKIANNTIDGTKIALGGDAQGDVMYYNGTDWARLAAGATGQFLKTQGAGANPAWAAAAGGGRLRQRGYAVGVAPFTTSSTTYVDVTDMSVTLTTTANADLVVYANFVCEIATSSPMLTFGFSLDGAAEAGEMTEQLHTNGVDMTIMLYHRFAAVSAASHTVKFRVKIAASTVTVGNAGTDRKMMLEEVSTT